MLFLRRLWGLTLRHAYLHIGSWPRLIEMLYWPIINMSVWGFTSLYLIRQWTDAAIIGSLFVGGVLLAEVFVRTSITMLLLFLEEIWSRNLGHLFASPMTFFDYSVGLIGVALVRMALGVIPAMIVAKFLFGFSILSYGWPLAAFIVLLVLNGFWYGLLILSMLFRYGLAAEWMAWMSTWLIIPIVAPYYPVSILPQGVQVVSWALPATYVFESVKILVDQHELRVDYLLISLGLNIFYLAVAGLVFYLAYQGARKRGGILQVGE